MSSSAIERKKLSLVLILLFITTLLFAQNWKSNFEGALESAASDNKPVILVFAGSDWCAPCIKLEKEIWESDYFKAYAKDHYIMYKADFPRKKSNKLSKELELQNKNLAEKYNAKGYFPLVVILNKDGKVLGETGYKKMSPEDYTKHLNSFLK